MGYDPTDLQTITYREVTTEKYPFHSQAFLKVSIWYIIPFHHPILICRVGGLGPSVSPRIMTLSSQIYLSSIILGSSRVRNGSWYNYPPTTYLYDRVSDKRAPRLYTSYLVKVSISIWLELSQSGTHQNSETLLAQGRWIYRGYLENLVPLVVEVPYHSM